MQSERWCEEKKQPEVVVAPDKLISIVQMRKKYSTLVANT